MPGSDGYTVHATCAAWASDLQSPQQLNSMWIQRTLKFNRQILYNSRWWKLIRYFIIVYSAIWNFWEKLPADSPQSQHVGAFLGKKKQQQGFNFLIVSFSSFYNLCCSELQKISLFWRFLHFAVYAVNGITADDVSAVISSLVKFDGNAAGQSDVTIKYQNMASGKTFKDNSVNP